MSSVSLCVISRDGERRLPQLLAMVEDHVDQMVVGVDSRTTDRTREIAQAFGATVYDFEWQDHFGKARNTALERATSEWLLILDDDELPDAEFLQALRELINDPAIDGYQVLGAHYLDGKFANCWYPSWHLRLFRSHCRYDGRVHEAPVGIARMGTAPGHVLHFMWSGPERDEKNRVYRRLEEAQKREGKA